MSTGTYDYSLSTYNPNSYSTYPSTGSNTFSNFDSFNSFGSSIFGSNLGSFGDFNLSSGVFGGGFGNYYGNGLYGSYTNNYTVGNSGYMGGYQWHTGSLNDDQKDEAITSIHNAGEVAIEQNATNKEVAQVIGTTDKIEHAEALSITQQCDNLMRVTLDRRPDQVLEQFNEFIEVLKKDPQYKGSLIIDEDGNEDDRLLRAAALDLFEQQQGVSLIDAVNKHCPGQFESRADATGSFGSRPRLSSDEVIAELTGVPHQDKPGERFFGNVCGGLGVLIGHGWLW